MEIYYLKESGKSPIITDSLEKVSSFKFMWINLVSPENHEIKTVSAFSKIPEEEFREFIEDEERSRIDYHGYLQIIYQAPVPEKGEVATEAVSMFIHKNIIVTTARSKVPSIDKIGTLLKKNKLKFLMRNAGTFVNYILDKINDDFFKSMEKIARVAQISKSEDIDVQQKILIKLYNSNVTLSHFNQAIFANLEIVNQLRKTPFKQFTKDDREEFTDLYYDTLQLIDTQKVQRDVITSIFNFQTVLSSYKLNNYMKQLTSLALIMLVPTLIASIYGMNISLPFDSSVRAFWIVMALMGAATLSIFLWFRKIDWI